MPSQKNRDRTEPNFGSVLSVLVLCISSELNFGNTNRMCVCWCAVVTTGLGLDVGRWRAHEVLEAPFFSERVERVVRVYAH